MNQNVHAINTTILQYAKQEDGMKGKAFENKTILKQMEQETKKVMADCLFRETWETDAMKTCFSVSL